MPTLNQALETSWPLVSGVLGYLDGAPFSLFTSWATSTTTTTTTISSVQHTLETLKRRKRKARAYMLPAVPASKSPSAIQIQRRSRLATQYITEHLVTTEEVNALRTCFEAELASRASKAAQANKMVASLPLRPRPRRQYRRRPRPRSQVASAHACGRREGRLEASPSAERIFFLFLVGSAGAGPAPLGGLRHEHGLLGW
ncbi:hypothetical protein BD626DRAFT_572393 [Schizophyllum amplum]|uniref:Uncharacterized protein n=1 Tax=Schizophyllum amplum TaxID=97359 RepID=A0A550C4T7_9AGAR|nr:hypothetical protein BD626DRAFT_572393 [Auriculariopsis ampla]